MDGGPQGSEQADDSAKGEAKSTRGTARKMGLAALILSVGILLSRVLGYVREAVIAYQQGASGETDAYYAAFTLPDMMNYFLAGGTLSITFIPMFSEYLAKDRESEGWQLYSLIASVIGLVLIGGIVVSEIFTEELVSVLVAGFDEEGIRRTAELTRIVLPCQLFHFLGGLTLATLLARGEFLAAALAPLVYNLTIIVCGLFLGPWLGMGGFAVGALAGSILGPFGVSLWFARKHIRFRPSFAIRSPEFKRYVWLSVPLMFGVSLMMVDEWYGRYFGSQLEESTISWLNYARRLMLVPIAIIAQAAGQAALPFLSRLAAEGRREELAELLTKALHYVLLLALVAAGLMWALAEPAIAVVYERGAFTASDTLKTAAFMELFALGIAAWAVQQVAPRAFFAEQDTWTPMWTATAVTLAAIPIYWYLGDRMGGEGLALAASVGMTLQATATLLVYRRSNPHLSLTRVGRSAGTGLILGLGAALIGRGATVGLSELGIGGGLLGSLLVLTIGGVAGVVAASALARLLVPDDFSRFVGRVSRMASRFRRSA